MQRCSLDRARTVACQCVLFHHSGCCGRWRKIGPSSGYCSISPERARGYSSLGKMHAEEFTMVRNPVEAELSPFLGVGWLTHGSARSLACMSAQYSSGNTSVLSTSGFRRRATKYASFDSCALRFFLAITLWLSSRLGIEEKGKEKPQSVGGGKGKGGWRRRGKQRTALDDSGFSRWTFSNSFFRRSSKAFSSLPW